jgi:hypothetical protein
MRVGPHEAEQRVVLHSVNSVTWDTCQGLLRNFENSRARRLTFDAIEVDIRKPWPHKVTSSLHSV